jgi:hypothetical protein
MSSVGSSDSVRIFFRWHAHFPPRPPRRADYDGRRERARGPGRAARTRHWRQVWPQSALTLAARGADAICIGQERPCTWRTRVLRRSGSPLHVAHTRLHRPASPLHAAHTRSAPARIAPARGADAIRIVPDRVCTPGSWTAPGANPSAPATHAFVPGQHRVCTACTRVWCRATPLLTRAGRVARAANPVRAACTRVSARCGSRPRPGQPRSRSIRIASAPRAHAFARGAIPPAPSADQCAVGPDPRCPAPARGLLTTCGRSARRSAGLGERDLPPGDRTAPPARVA